MTKGQRVALGVATIFPLFYILIVLLTPLRIVFTTDPMSPQAPDWFLYFTALHFFMYLYTGLLLAFYLIHLFGNKGMNRESKALWAFLLIVGSIFTMPVYWYLHIWRSKD